MKCLICLDSIDYIEFLPCSHGFHTNCINEWINEKPYCPICKIPISIKTPDELIIYNKDRNIIDNNNIRKNLLYQRINELTNNTETSDENPSNNSEILQSSLYEINNELQNILEFEHRFNNKYYNNFNGRNNINNIIDIINSIQNTNRIVIPVNRIHRTNNISNTINRFNII